MVDTVAGPPQQHTLEGGASSNQSSVSRTLDSKFQHIENVDQFFTRIYEYQQGGGFLCVAVRQLMALVQFVFIVFFSTFFAQCVDYSVLFNDKQNNTHGDPIVGKRHFSDAMVPDCSSHLNFFVVIFIGVALVFWVFRAVKTGYYLLQMKDVQDFYAAIGVHDHELTSLTWHHIVQRLCQNQPRLRFLIQNEKLTPLHVYHRILRYQNYFVALVNKRLLPPFLQLPFVGEIAYLPSGLLFNLKWLLCWGYMSPWKGPYNLKDEYRDRANLPSLAAELEKTILFMGLANLVLSPLVLVYQILYSFYSLAELVKREPGALGTRRYSNYGRYRCRHFNELSHELRVRLNRSHYYASEYLNQFYSPLGEIFARNLSFMAAAVFAVLAGLSAWDEDVLAVEHVLTVMTVCGVVFVVCRSLIPNENLVWQPEELLARVVSELHCAPSDWKGQAHEERVRKEFSEYFQLKTSHFVEELLSPIITPFILLFWIRPLSHELVKFFHSYTVTEAGLGDVCSFALLDIARHGDPTWFKAIDDNDNNTDVRSSARALDGKTELSVLHFAATNPEWQPPPGSQRFLKNFKTRVDREMATARDGVGRSLLMESLHPLLSAPLSSLPLPPLSAPRTLASFRQPPASNLHRLDGPSNTDPTRSLISSMHQSGDALAASLRASGVRLETAAGEMSVNALFLREMHAEAIRPHVHNYESVAGVDVWGVPEQSVIGTLGGPRLPEESRLRLISEEDEARERDDLPPGLFQSV